jgi:hypothetical protein
MKTDALAKLLLAAAAVGLFAVLVSMMTRPAGADAADDLVREVARLNSNLDDANRALEGMESELKGIRQVLEQSDLIDLSLTSSGAGMGIPVTVQNP